MATKMGLMDAPAIGMGVYRFALGGTVVLLAAVYRGVRLLPSGSNRASEYKRLAGLGLLFSVQLAFFNLGQDRTSASHASVITASYPLWAATVAHFFVHGDRLSLRRTGGAVLAYLGVASVFYSSLAGDGASSMVGDGLMVCSAALLAIRQIVISELAQSIAVERLLVAQATLGIVTFGISSRLFESEGFSWGARLVVSLAYQGILIAGVAFLVQAWLLKHFLPSRVALIFVTQPLFGVVLGWWILGEPVGWPLLVGAVFVIGGAWMIQSRE